MLRANKLLWDFSLSLDFGQTIHKNCDKSGHAFEFYMIFNIDTMPLFP